VHRPQGVSEVQSAVVLRVMAGDLHRLRILHVSDLHAVDPAADRHRQRRGLVLGHAWQENLDTIVKDGPIDLVCFTGDLAFSGKDTEYDRLTVFVDALLARTGVPRSRLFVVPGNHDIDRTIAPGAVASLRSLNDDEKLSYWMLGGRAPRGVDETHRDEVLERQGAYRRWVGSKLNRPEMLPDTHAAHPRLGYRETIRVRDLPFDIHVIGLDSAWLAHDNSDARKLLLTRDQVLRLSAGPDGELLDGFRLALIHHPLTELGDGEASRRLLAEQIDLLLRGHLHDTELSFWSDTDRALRELAVGSLYGGDQWPNGCHVIDVQLDGAGRPRRYDLWFRGWSGRGRGFWADDDRLYKGSRQGRLSWSLRVEAAREPATKPARRAPDASEGREEDEEPSGALPRPGSKTEREGRDDRPAEQVGQTNPPNLPTSASRRLDILGWMLLAVMVSITGTVAVTRIRSLDPAPTPGPSGGGAADGRVLHATTSAPSTSVQEAPLSVGNPSAVISSPPTPAAPPRVSATVPQPHASASSDAEVCHPEPEGGQGVWRLRCLCGGHEGREPSLPVTLQSTAAEDPSQRVKVLVGKLAERGWTCP
jgi:predicted MPP superfamily phosphohydrolase